MLNNSLLNKNILITGANGFIGKPLLRALGKTHCTVRATVRSEAAAHSLTQFQQLHKIKQLSILNQGELGEKIDWYSVLEGTDTIIHCAGLAHVLSKNKAANLEKFRQINSQATEVLVKQASILGVRRFILLSSIGVLGNSSGDLPFSESSIPNPQTPYSISKLEAENIVKTCSGAMEWIIIRPPLVYGPEAKGNFKRLLSLINKNIPLPLGAVKNKRQMISLDNLVDFILTCIIAPKAANELFLIADKEAVTTTELIKILRNVMGKHTPLLPIPTALLNIGFKCIGQSRLIEQLIDNLEIDTSKAKDKLGWEAPYTLHEQLHKSFN